MQWSPSIAARDPQTSKKTLMNQSAVTTSPLSDGVRKALEVSLRGVEELLPQDEWAKKLARSESTGKPLRN